MTGKIFARATQSKGAGRKPRDEKARKRNVIINFRVTPEEKERIEARIALSGLSKSEYFIESCLYQTVLVKGNVRTFQAYERALEELSEGIRKGGRMENMAPRSQESLRMILEIMDRLFGPGS